MGQGASLVKEKENVAPLVSTMARSLGCRHAKTQD